VVIKFTPHAKDKLLRLKAIGVTKEKVIKAIEKPEKLTDGYWKRKIAQSKLTEDLVLRVIYEELEEDKIVVTIYPAQRRRYENKI